MSKSMSLLWAALLICMTACKKEQAAQDKKLTPVLKSESPILASVEYGTDWSGTVQIAIVDAIQTGTQPKLDIKVPDGYALIGGGAGATPLVDSSNAFLTASYPDADFTTWHAASTYHIRPREHTLFAYAIGLKVTGFTKEQLTSYMLLFSTTSRVAPHPDTFASVTNFYTLIGGGAKVNSAGNLLVHSYPSGSAWFAGSKDHIYDAPSSITAYALGIKTELLQRASLEIVRDSAASYVSSGIGATPIFIDSTWVVGCPGGAATYAGVGRMLIDIKPQIRHAAALSKDLDYPDGGTTAVYVLKIRRKR
ncbi:hypothetical protein [Chitinophaga tropicalis]|uniref:Uncharacterized protein n=1 Tax=Chitinophaga tropicalis TaxID=2683588 RepID=A0A7K1U4L4_9BACT|nr:hypothetical protein [Chitinophaga tropicalis]MVT09298.1 hypothetical protein [Chitinophaga tropicalis]